MTTVISYKTPQAYLDNTAEILEFRELENNLILGICNGFADKTKEYDGCVFINAVADNCIQVSSIKTISKAIITGTSKDIRHIKSLTDYYIDHGIPLTGVVGESVYSAAFSNYYGRKLVNQRTMIVHKLLAVNPLPLAPGKLDMATMNDIDLLTDWTIHFEKDTGTFPKQSREQIVNSTRTRVGSGHFFKWIANDETVSIAAIVRKTRNVGVVGLVYTPDSFRGKGYATSCVQKVSEHILSAGYSCCGLFTDQSNPTSNHIYKKIGYVPTSTFTDIEFEQ